MVATWRVVLVKSICESVEILVMGFHLCTQDLTTRLDWPFKKVIVK